MLIQIFLNALGFPQQEGRVLVGTLDEFLQHLHRVPKFLGELGVLLILPGIAQRREARLQERHAVLQFGVEPLEFFGEAPDFAGIHDGLWHVRSSRFGLFAGGKLTEGTRGFQSELLFRVLGLAPRGVLLIQSVLFGKTCYVTQNKQQQICGFGSRA